MHKVERVKINCSVRGLSIGPSSIAVAAGEGDRLCDQLFERLRVILPRLLDKVCGQLPERRGDVTGGPANYKFGRLNLDLGHVRLDDLEERLESELACSLANALDNKARGGNILFASDAESGDLSGNGELDGAADARDSGSSQNRMFVKNAGLALLAPFLRHYFIRLGLLGADSYFKSAEHQSQAVVATHILCEPEFFANQQFDDAELRLSKFMCGWPLDTPIIWPCALPAGELSGQMHELQKERVTLLHAVLNQWPILIITQHDFFTMQFLQRNAIIEYGKHCYRLYVERLPQDAVLSTLPWALSFASLPWMQSPMEVIWHD